MSGSAVLISILLLGANAWFVALEFALIASRRTQLQPLAAQGRRSAAIALVSLDERSVHLAGAQLGITMASLALGAVAEPAIAHFLERVLHDAVTMSEPVRHTVAFIVALGIVVLMHMVLGEMVPKNIAIAGPERTLMAMARADRAYQRLLRPVLRVLNGAADLGVRALGVDPDAAPDEAHTPDEFASMIAASRDEGLLGELEHDLLASALGFDGLLASAVMVPRAAVVSVARSATVQEVEAVMRASGHSRLPIVRGDLDDVAGFVHVKDVLALPSERCSRPLPLAAVRHMLVVRAEDPLEQVLHRMRRSRVHFALVVAPTGGTVGIVTLEDLLEELVGAIEDETDRGGGR